MLQKSHFNYFLAPLGIRAIDLDYPDMNCVGLSTPVWKGLLMRFHNPKLYNMTYLLPLNVFFFIDSKGSFI